MQEEGLPEAVHRFRCQPSCLAGGALSPQHGGHKSCATSSDALQVTALPGKTHAPCFASKGRAGTCSASGAAQTVEPRTAWEQGDSCGPQPHPWDSPISIAPQQSPVPRASCPHRLTESWGQTRHTARGRDGDRALRAHCQQPVSLLMFSPRQADSISFRFLTSPYGGRPLLQKGGTFSRAHLNQYFSNNPIIKVKPAQRISTSHLQQ